MARSFPARYGARVFRLLLSIVALLLTVPAVAAPACHEAVPSQVATAMHHHGDTPAPAQPAAAMHECIGCIPPSDWLGSTLAALLIVSGDGPRALASAAPHGRALKPTPPPPRLA